MKKGFTLIELLVVIVIIGILATLATVALSSARSKARDARRVSDVKQIMTALDLFYNEAQGYPTTDDVGTGDAIVSNGNTFMAKVPGNASPVDGTACAAAGTSYKYKALSAQANGYYADYTLEYCLGGKTGAIESGAHTAKPSGIE